MTKTFTHIKKGTQNAPLF